MNSERCAGFKVYFPFLFLLWLLWPLILAAFHLPLHQDYLSTTKLGLNDLLIRHYDIYRIVTLKHFDIYLN